MNKIIIGLMFIFSSLLHAEMECRGNTMGVLLGGFNQKTMSIDAFDTITKKHSDFKMNLDRSSDNVGVFNHSYEASSTRTISRDIVLNLSTKHLTYYITAQNLGSTPVTQKYTMYCTKK